ncbi:hypothetical protein C4K05_1584 [Pseudomonas chlororaphis subsp. aureofaciens]|uniref:Uncharacterized protein n=1 Tax=Pseudomonas chlororaphis subsp. aureofaciens TaxID=587851 RepID=A0AAD0ZFS8_9PSED|nr:hypothetical protein C4K08_1566 [Pseudomonas chlororaphis subsp. aureofaciens]AZE28359.1 hypothetical protein C4K07_1559 [Pseudomonas chlororaphis subsp. aureofaciens]AZE34606.1 hypothetical protein C4K06_1558 [Pseudomonas chlororaphis subsp. aureofaciens]AZE40939.1 hypothetical protein C4K05_1584 [Pseudomonas chlororaphis subsp. aureofaciens]
MRFEPDDVVGQGRDLLGGQRGADRQVELLAKRQMHSFTNASRSTNQKNPTACGALPLFLPTTVRFTVVQSPKWRPGWRPGEWCAKDF